MKLKTSVLFKLTIGFILSLILTIVVVRYSTTHGKLTIPPDYDDSHSLVEGGLRYLVWKHDGVSAAWQHYIKNPPHSFLHYYLTALLFASFGIHQTTPYWFSGVFAFVAVTGVTLLLLDVGFLEFMALITAFLCLPVMFNMIFDFRSECAMAAFLFTACCLAVRSAWASRYDRLLAFISGIFFALCLGLKPAMFIYVLGMLFSCCLLWIAIGLFRKGVRIRHAIGNAGIAVLVAIVPFSFHYYLNANQIFGYIYTNAFASDFWKQKGTVMDQLLFHLFGFAGQFQLGAFTWPLLSLNAIGGILIVIFGKRLDLRLQGYYWSMLFLCIMAYAGVAINSINQNYFGMTFDLLLAGSALLLLGIIAKAMPGYSGVIVCLLVAALSLSAWRVPMTQDYVARTRAVGGEPALDWRRTGPEKVFRLVRSAWHQDSSPKIWVGAYGWVDGNTVTWESVKSGLPWKMWNYYARQPENGLLYPQWADILIIPEPGVMGTIELPLNKDIPAMASAAAKDNSLGLVGTVTDPAGKKICVYLRKDTAHDSEARE
jgi:hypothetical protein